MSEIVSFTNRNALLENQIAEQIEALVKVEPLRLPEANAPLVTSFRSKLEGSYEVERIKTDTDHAIELLYIAYNTTPQEQGEIRVRIAGIMHALIRAQQDSESSIKGAVRIAERITRQLRNLLPDWLDVKETNDAEEIRHFVSTDLLAMARDIAASAGEVRADLTSIVNRYERILADIEAVMASSELALSETIEANRKIKQEIVEATARREQLDQLVSELQQQVERFEVLARRYGEQANSAEQKSFWAGLLKSATQVLAAVLPLAALGATGGSSALFGAVTVGALNRQPNADIDPGKLVEQANLEGQRQVQLGVVEEHKRRVSDLAAQYAAATGELVKQELEKGLEQERGALREAQTKLAGVEQQLGALLRELAQAASDVSEQMKEQAASLRQLEFQMLDNVERYENVRREQAVELVRITVLLGGKRSEQQSIELAVKSLNLSVAALKRSKEIVEEIAFFFRAFVDFMQLIIDEALERVEDYDRAGNSESLRRNRLQQLLLTTDCFFITQTAEWHAVSAVSQDFVQLFNDGWSKLNKLSGSYIIGEELQDYLVQAAHQLNTIAEARDAVSTQRLASLDSYRRELQERAAQG